MVLLDILMYVCLSLSGKTAFDESIRLVVHHDGMVDWDHPIETETDCDLNNGTWTCVVSLVWIYRHICISTFTHAPTRTTDAETHTHTHIHTGKPAYPHSPMHAQMHTHTLI